MPALFTIINVRYMLRLFGRPVVLRRLFYFLEGFSVYEVISNTIVR